MDYLKKRDLDKKLSFVYKSISDLHFGNLNSKKFPSLKMSMVKEKKDKNKIKNDIELNINKNNKLIENCTLTLKEDYEKENKELKNKIELLQKENLNLKRENYNLKKQLEEEKNLFKNKQDFLFKNQKLKFNSFNNWLSSNNNNKKDYRKYSFFKEYSYDFFRKNSPENTFSNSIDFSPLNKKEIKNYKNNISLTLNSDSKSRNYIETNQNILEYKKILNNNLKRMINLFQKYNSIIIKEKKNII